MKLIQSPFSDPAINLALEEFLFESTEDEYILLYINSDAVICGKHQNAVSESNAQFLFENKVPLHRRFSGGGTVYHDKGNLNLSFITTGEDSNVIDFKRYGSSMVRFLKSFGVKAALTERNDVAIDGYKVSGHAAHAKNKRALHHGTLLYDSQLQKLSEGLRSNEDKFESRAVKSVRSPVANVRQYMKNDLDINDFTEMLSDHLSKEFSASGAFLLDEASTNKVNDLATSKYRTFEWNYGYGPDYSFEINHNGDGIHLELELKVSKACFTELIVGEKTTFDPGWDELIGKSHRWFVIHDFLSKNLKEADPANMTKLFF